ncbi:zinc-binding dehydrogenase [Actinomadura macrotermitis]|uniref:Crotonyl-CoA reductase n=1 Tax=Actinomadura macrotermitis TaxID=2585200 RepID=A0A7K0BY34_9ACTN|nr:zinc-binding dehydrogenase [Actinomadura macrotermitis]MQY06098.1 Crotonyl-CoA reductase [Actinomadura macrotermitis]
MNTMKALQATGDAGLVAFADVPVPRPAPDEALVRVEAFSVNRGEIFQLQRPPERHAPGWRPGKDVAGVVVEAARDGSGPRAGQRVVAHPPGLGWAEYAAVRTADLAQLPEQVPSALAAALPLAGITALRLLRTAGALAGRRVLVTGASGGVGHYVVELAAGAGAEVTAVSATPDRGRRLRELGAAAVVTGPGEATGPFDVVLESVGGDSLPRALALLAPGGTLVWFGQASRQPVTLNFFDFFDGPEGAAIRHFHYAGGPYGPDLATLVRLVAAGRLHPEIGRTAGWDGTAAVLADLHDRKITGNAVLEVAR